MRMLDVEGFILVGGESSRMGRDKSRLVFDGQTSVERITGALRPLTSRIRLVGARAATDHALPNLPDLRDGWGPLGGICTALRAAEAEWCAVVACDLPLVTAALLERLWEFTPEAEPPRHEAVVPIQNDGRPQPLCALYRRTCRSEAEKLIANGEHTPRALVDRVVTRFIQFDEISDLSGAEHFFFKHS